MSMVNLTDLDPSFDHLRQFRSSLELSAPSSYETDRFDSRPDEGFRSATNYESDENYSRLGPRWHSMDVLNAPRNVDMSTGRTSPEMYPYSEDLDQPKPQKEYSRSTYDLRSSEFRDPTVRQQGISQRQNSLDVPGQKPLRDSKYSRISEETLERPKLLRKLPNRDVEQLRSSEERPRILPRHQARQKPKSSLRDQGTVDRRRRSKEGLRPQHDLLGGRPVNRSLDGRLHSGEPPRSPGSGNSSAYNELYGTFPKERSRSSPQYDTRTDRRYVDERRYSEQPSSSPIGSSAYPGSLGRRGASENHVRNYRSPTGLGSDDWSTNESTQPEELARTYRSQTSLISNRGDKAVPRHMGPRHSNFPPRSQRNMTSSTSRGENQNEQQSRTSNHETSPFSSQISQTSDSSYQDGQPRPHPRTSSSSLDVTPNRHSVERSGEPRATRERLQDGGPSGERSEEPRSSTEQPRSSVERSQEHRSSVERSQEPRSLEKEDARSSVERSQEPRSPGERSWDARSPMDRSEQPRAAETWSDHQVAKLHSFSDHQTGLKQRAYSVNVLSPSIPSKSSSAESSREPRSSAVRLQDARSSEERARDPSSSLGRSQDARSSMERSEQARATETWSDHHPFKSHSFSDNQTGLKQRAYSMNVLSPSIPSKSSFVERSEEPRSSEERSKDARSLEERAQEPRASVEISGDTRLSVKISREPRTSLTRSEEPRAAETWSDHQLVESHSFSDHQTGLKERAYSMNVLSPSTPPNDTGQRDLHSRCHSADEPQPSSDETRTGPPNKEEGQQNDSPGGLADQSETDPVAELLMAEGRKSQVILLDDRKLEFLIQPKLLSCDLLDLVASHFNLKEKEYCGLAYLDETGHFYWLQLDRRVLEHDFPKKTGPLVLHFLVRFFIESIGFLRDRATVEVFYLQAKQAIYKGLIECDSETVFELAAHVLQATHGDFTSEDTARIDIKKLPLLPVRTLQEHPSLPYCEDQIINQYKKLSGLSRGSAIVNYMTICESLPTYGIHYYEVKDKSGLPWWLGLSHKGISQFDHCDKKVPRRVFPWKQLENLYFRDRKFSIEVHDPKRVSVSRRTFGPSNVNVYAWLTSTPQLTKCIWSMAVSQHQFYLDRKQSKNLIPAVRSMSEIAADLSQSTPSLHSSAASDSISLGSTQSLTISNCSKLDCKYNQLPPEEAAEYAAAKREMYEALKARKAALEEALKRKTEELKALCLQEGELTGELPIETPLAPGEALPIIRRRVGTAFTLSPKNISGDHQTEEEEEIAKLELEYELQKQISSAAHKLAQDKRMTKKVRKQRKEAYMKSHARLKELEKKLNDLHRNIGRAALTAHSSVDESDAISQHSGSPAVHKKLLLNSHENTKVEIVEVQRPNMLSNEHAPSTGSSQCSLSENVSPQSPSKQLSRDSTPSPSRAHHTGQTGYMPSSIYTTRTQYRNQMYPTFSMRQSVSSNQSDYDNMSQKGSKGDLNQEDCNVYNISTNRTSRYDSEDNLEMSRIEPYVTPENPERTDYRYVYNADDERLRHLPRNRHGSLDASFQRKGSSSSSIDKHYGSLERNFSYSGQTAFMAEKPEYQAGQYEVEHTPADSETDVSRGERERPGEGDEKHWYETQESGVNTENPPEYSERDRPPDYDSSRPKFYIQENPPEYGQGEERRGQEDNPIPHPYVGQIPQGQTFTTVHQYPNYKEESKPFEMSDFYKYSEKLRRQRSIERQHLTEPPRRPISPASSHCSSASSHSERAFVPHYAHSVPVMRKDTLSPQPDYAYTGSLPGSAPRGVCAPVEEHYHCGPPSPGPVLSPSPQLAHVPHSPQMAHGVPHSPQMAHGVPHSPQMAHGSPGPYVTPGRASPYHSPTPQRSQRLYQSPQPMKCEPVKELSDLKNSQRCIADKFHDMSLNSSFGPDPTQENLADRFSEEMLAWYDDQGGNDPKNASFV